MRWEIRTNANQDYKFKCKRMYLYHDAGGYAERPDCDAYIFYNTEDDDNVWIIHVDQPAEPHIGPFGSIDAAKTAWLFMFGKDTP